MEINSQTFENEKSLLKNVTKNKTQQILNCGQNSEGVLQNTENQLQSSPAANNVS